MKTNNKHEVIKHPDHTRIVIAAHQKEKERDYWINKLSGEMEKSFYVYIPIVFESYMKLRRSRSRIN